jgi:hypothetical protein
MDQRDRARASLGEKLRDRLPGESRRHFGGDCRTLTSGGRRPANSLRGADQIRFGNLEFHRLVVVFHWDGDPEQTPSLVTEISTILYHLRLQRVPAERHEHPLPYLDLGLLIGIGHESNVSPGFRTAEDLTAPRRHRVDRNRQPVESPAPVPAGLEVELARDQFP